LSYRRYSVLLRDEELTAGEMVYWHRATVVTAADYDATTIGTIN